MSPINLFLSRLEVDADLVKIDQEISSKYESENIISVMYGVDWEAIIENYDVAHSLRVQKKFLSLLNRVFHSNEGTQMSHLIFFFDDPVKALEACIEARREIVEVLNANEEDMVPLKGFGLHIGKVLVVEGTDILFGDPINTSSKLGEDIAEDMEINITDTIYNIVKDRETDIQFTAKVKDLSGVHFNYYSC